MAPRPRPSGWRSVRGRPLVIAHRGASRAAPENTLAAFRLAGELGADGIELDARLTLDGEVVVFHDRLLKRMTGARGRVADTPAREIARLAIRTKGAAGRERIPLLSEVLRRFSPAILVNIELKPDPSPRRARELAAAVCRIVAAGAAQGSVLLSSFSLAALREAKRLLPGVPAALLYHPVIHLSRSPLRLARRCGAEAVFLNRASARARLIRSLRDAGFVCGEYTVNTKRRMARALRRGVGVIFTDDPAAILRMIP